MFIFPFFTLKRKEAKAFKEKETFTRLPCSKWTCRDLIDIGNTSPG